MERALRILHLEDDPVDGELVAELLREGGLAIEVERVFRLAAFEEGLGRESLSLILSDYTVPGVDALAALRLARRKRPEVPFIFVSGTMGEDIAIEALKNGASDYVLKQRIDRLVPAVKRALREAEEQSRRKKAEEALEKSEERFRAIFDNAGLGIAEADTTPRIREVNERWRQIVKRSREELIGMSVHDLTHPEDRAESDRVNADLIAGRVPRVSYQKRYLRGDGTFVWVRVTISAIRGETGEFLRSIAMLEDISERKQAEEALRAAQQELKQTNAKLDRLVQERTAALRETISDLEHFSYSITHDMRAPLRAMQGFTVLLEEDICAGCQQPQSKEYFRRIKVAASRMDKLIQDCLDYSKIMRQELPLTVVDIPKLVQGMIESYPQFQPPAAEITLECDTLEVRGNEAGLTQCFSNLLGNAIKFVAPGVKPRVRIYSENRGDKVRIWVADNGIGIPEEARKKIFGIFERLHRESEYPGTGIGLAIVHKAMQRMGGEAGFESEPGKGSKFWIELPATKTTPEEKEE